MSHPLIFDIARGSFVDGPGVRTVVFLKGCPLRCVWCHNPEAQSPLPEPLFILERCIHCGRCERGLSCFTGARCVVGLWYQPEELVEELLRDKSYFDETGGGVTFSGGEPLLFIPYLSEVLPRLKQAGIHVALQTAGHFDFEEFRDKLSNNVDLIYYDLKIFDPTAHERSTGIVNDLILENLPRLIALGVRVLPRIPLIASHTATEENLAKLAHYLRQLGASEVEFLFYNPGAAEKCQRLGHRPLSGEVIEPLSLEAQLQWIEFFRRQYSVTDGADGSAFRRE